MPTIFYSWQNDSKKTNRNLIEDALEKATKALEATIENALRPEDSEDGSTKIEIQQGARGVPGAPDIPRTIFARIDGADAFVCDVSLIIQTEKRRSPNPNVLVELGYALKALGDSRVLMVVNTAFGPLEDLPFDLRTKLPVVYHLDPDGKKADERVSLAGELTRRLREVITQPRLTQTDAVDRAITAIREKSADRQHRVRDAVDHLVSELDKINVPRTAEVPATDTEVIAAIRLS